MKHSDIYRRAAQMIERNEEEYSCAAIAIAGGFYSRWDQDRYRPPVISKYVLTFAEDEYVLQNQFEREESPRDLRVLALCFMAAAKD